MLAGDGRNKEEAEAGAFDLDGVAAGHAVEALKDSLEVFGIEAEAVVGDGERDLRIARDGDGAGNVDSIGRVFDRVVEDVEDGEAQVFREREVGRASCRERV